MVKCVCVFVFVCIYYVICRYACMQVCECMSVQEYEYIYVWMRDCGLLMSELFPTKLTK